jgi:hypothetical protein
MSYYKDQALVFTLTGFNVDFKMRAYNTFYAATAELVIRVNGHYVATLATITKDMTSSTDYTHYTFGYAGAAVAYAWVPTYSGTGTVTVEFRVNVGSNLAFYQTLTSDKISVYTTLLCKR